MNIAQFALDDEHGFLLYKWDGIIATELGDFDVEIQIIDDSPLTEELVGLASRLSESGKSNAQKVLDIIFHNYKNCDPMSLMDFDVPSQLSRNEIMDYVDSKSFVVIKDQENERESDTYIQIQPQWDEEHGIFIRIDGDAIEIFDPMSD